MEIKWHDWISFVIIWNPHLAVPVLVDAKRRNHLQYFQICSVNLFRCIQVYQNSWVFVFLKSSIVCQTSTFSKMIAGWFSGAKTMVNFSSTDSTGTDSTSIGIEASNFIVHPNFMVVWHTSPKKNPRARNTLATWCQKFLCIDFFASDRLLHAEVSTRFFHPVLPQQAGGPHRQWCRTMEIRRSICMWGLGNYDYL